jgi:ubiquinone biosynthesis protein COQ9
MSMGELVPGEEDPVEAVRGAVVETALPHVPFDGWSDRTLARAVEDAGVDAGSRGWPFRAGVSTWRWRSTTPRTGSWPGGSRRRT